MAGREGRPEHFPHDRFFRYLTKQREFYLPFLRFYLPPWVREQFVMEEMRPASESFLRKTGLIASDAVFRSPLRDGAGEGCVVVELQAARDGEMDLRTFGYKAGGFEQLLAEVGKGGCRPGLVYVLVVYIGSEGWRPRLDPFLRLPSGAQAAARRAWEEPAGFVNLRDEKCLPPSGEALLSAGVFLLAHGRDGDPREMLRCLDPLLGAVSELTGGRELVHRMLLYAGQIATGRRQSERAKLFEEGIARHLHGVAREEAMSIWETIGRKHELQGLRQGLQQGLEKGKLEGKLEKALEIARNMLNEGIPITTIARVTHLPKQKLTALREKT